MLSLGLPRWLSDKESACQPSRRHKFNPQVGKIPWRRRWRPTPILLPGESMGRGAWWATVHGVTELDTTERLSSRSSRLLNPGSFQLWSQHTSAWAAYKQQEFPPHCSGGCKSEIRSVRTVCLSYLWTVFSPREHPLMALLWISHYVGDF